MTAQMSEVLLHRGNTLDLCDDPLHLHIRTLPEAEQPKFAFSSTALWRGYVCTWSTEGGILSLLALEGYRERGTDLEKVGLGDVFPDWQPPVPATWATAWFRCPEGRRLDYVHMGWGSRYERDRIFRVIQGRIVGEWVRLSGPGEGDWRAQPRGARPWVRQWGEVVALYRIRPDRSRIPVADYRLNAPALPDPLGRDGGRPGDPAWDGPEPDGAEATGYSLGAWMSRLPGGAPA